MKIADLRRSSACSGSNCRRFAHITAQREAFLGSSPVRASATARAASSGCWLTYGLSAGRCFQRLKLDLLLSLATSSAAARARRRRLPRPRRAQQAVRSGLPREAAVHSLFLAPLRLSVVLLLVRRTRARGRGGEGGTIIAFPGSILGDARRPLSAPCRAQQAVRSGRCAEKLPVLFVACVIVWLIALCG